MKQTPMQELIDIIVNHAETYKGKEELRVKKAYLDIICAIEDFKLLEKEKQVIEDAFNQGYREGESETMVADLKKGISEFDDAINYYNETFKQK